RAGMWRIIENVVLTFLPEKGTRQGMLLDREGRRVGAMINIDANYVETHVALFNLDFETVTAKALAHEFSHLAIDLSMTDIESEKAAEMKKRQYHCADQSVDADGWAD